MDLRTYFKSLQPEQREHVAHAAGTTPSYLQKCAYGFAKVPPAVAVALEEISDMKVTRKEMRPHDWDRLWPELAAVR